MSNKYKTLAHEWFEEVWNQGNVGTIDRLLAADAALHGITDENGRELRGPADFKVFHSKFLKAFPSLKVEVMDTVVEGDKFAVRCVVRGRHEGDDLGFAATQKDVEITGIAMARVKDGKFAETWNNFDFLSLYSQLGALNQLGK